MATGRLPDRRTRRSSDLTVMDRDFQLRTRTLRQLTRAWYKLAHVRRRLPYAALLGGVD
jgi:hypothetical protein